MNRNRCVLLSVALALGCATSNVTPPQPGYQIDEPDVLARLASAMACPPDQVFSERWSDAAVAEGCGRHAYLSRSLVTGEWKDLRVVELGDANPIPWNPGMGRPRKVDGPDPVLPFDPGPRTFLSIVKCVIDVDGAVRGCSVVKETDPRIDAAIVAALHSSHYEPFRYRGRTVAVDYQFNVLLRGRP